MSHNGPWPRRLIAAWPYFGLLAVLGAVTLLYLPTLGAYFHGDDYVAFTEFKTKGFIQYSRDVFEFHDANFYWRPLGKIFHRVLYEGFGLNPLPFRLAALGFFLATLAAIYAFCVRQGLGVWVGLAAAALFGVLPNQVVSASWVTNTSRLMAVLFVLLCLVALQRRRRWGPAWEAGALALFIIGVLSDETALALTPLPVLYAAFVSAQPFSWKSAIPRLAAYSAVAVALVPMQFGSSLDEEPRLAFYGVGPHIVDQTWALASQLVLPVASAEPVDVLLGKIPAVEWAFGLAAIIAGAFLLITGSRLTRFLVVWAGLALAPFTLWDLNYTAPRYVYMAAVPYSIFLGWALVNVVRWLSLPRPSLPRLALARGGFAAASIVLAAMLVVSADTVLARNERWDREAEKYRILAQGLKDEFPTVAPGSRIVILYSDLPDFWATVVAQSIYGDRSIRVTNVPTARAESTVMVFGSRDRVVYLAGNRFLPRVALSGNR